MYRDPALWKKIRQRILVDGISIHEISRVTGISRPTIRKMLRNQSPVPYSASFSEPKSRPSARRVVHVRKKDRAKELAFGWMRSVLQGQIAIPRLRSEVADLGDIEEFACRLYLRRLTERNRSMVILAKHHGIPQHLICGFLGINRRTARSYRKARIVLTSNDSAFSEELDRVRSILANLREDEAFFSIDEFGPFAVKTKPGLALAAPGERRVVPPEISRLFDFNGGA